MEGYRFCSISTKYWAIKGFLVLTEQHENDALIRRASYMGRKLTLSTKIVSLGVAITVCFSLSLAWVYTEYKTSTLDSRSRELRQLADVASSMVVEYDQRAARGEFSSDEAKKMALSRIKTLRYNK